MQGKRRNNLIQQQVILPLFQMREFWQEDTILINSHLHHQGKMQWNPLLCTRRRRPLTPLFLMILRYFACKSLTRKHATCGRQNTGQLLNMRNRQPCLSPNLEKMENMQCDAHLYAA
ncbi:hypothetical protein PBY51_024091 [Eleginops maclovinus]|uniref:Uncharacterized protein n=1 Tax=Eleginops maclovinus TaxID=56733 RepID=A0AAN8AR89_ELEMC|nr:hypothetical protein PBY51_024091 [Eleginops maclovinus]